MILAGRTSRRVFCCWLLLLFYLAGRVLRFWALFPCYQHSTQAREGIHQLWALSWLLLVALLFPGFSVRFLSRAQRVWAGIFYPQAFLPCTTSTHFGTFCDTDPGRNTPSRVLFCTCSRRVVSFGWHMALNYSCLNYSTIGLSIAPVRYEV